MVTQASVAIADQFATRLGPFTDGDTAANLGGNHWVIKDSSGNVISDLGVIPPLAPPPVADGWQIASLFVKPQGGPSFSVMRGLMIVPPNPTTTANTPLSPGGQLIYLFPSFQSQTDSRILQPVLRYFGGVWSCASWYVFNNNNSVVKSNDVVVRPGWMLTWEIKGQPSATPGKWDYTCQFLQFYDLQQGPVNIGGLPLTQVNATGVDELGIANGTAVEMYYHTACTNYPPDVATGIWNATLSNSTSPYLSEVGLFYDAGDGNPNGTPYPNLNWITADFRNDSITCGTHLQFRTIFTTINSQQVPIPQQLVFFHF
jgi:hypothetical protein